MFYLTSLLFMIKLLLLRKLVATVPQVKFCGSFLIYSTKQEEGTVLPAQTELNLQITVTLVDGGGVEKTNIYSL